MTTMFILNNVGRYLCCLTMKPVPAGAVKPQLTVDVMMQLQPYTEEIIARLNGKEQLEDIAADIAPRAEVTPAQVVLYTANRFDTLRRKS